MAVVSKKAQIILSAGTTAIGAILTWLVITFIFGRIYCSTVCPVGTLSDLFIRIRRRIPALDKKFSYRKQTRLPIHILMIYAICLPGRSGGGALYNRTVEYHAKHRLGDQPFGD